MSIKNYKWLTVAGVVLVLDFISKIYMQKVLVHGDVNVSSNFNLHLAYNEGAAFSFLATHPYRAQVLTAITIGIVSYLLFWLLKLSSEKLLLTKISLSLIIGGALGNLIDRFQYGHVIDFIQVHYKTFYWPTFNIADTAITIGALLLIGELISKKKEALRFKYNSEQ